MITYLNAFLFQIFLNISINSKNYHMVSLRPCVTDINLLSVQCAGSCSKARRLRTALSLRPTIPACILEIPSAITSSTAATTREYTSRFRPLTSKAFHRSKMRTFQLLPCLATCITVFRAKMTVTNYCISWLPNVCMRTSGPPLCNCRSFGCILLLNQIYLTTIYRSTYNSTPIYLTNLLSISRLGLGLDLELHYFTILSENKGE